MFQGDLIRLVRFLQKSLLFSLSSIVKDLNFKVMGLKISVNN